MMRCEVTYIYIFILLFNNGMQCISLLATIDFYLVLDGSGTLRPTRWALERTRSIWVTSAATCDACDV
jgi:hypothetical protein